MLTTSDHTETLEVQDPHTSEVQDTRTSEISDELAHEIDQIEIVEEPSGEKRAGYVLKAYNALGQVSATSSDGGTTWTRTLEGIALDLADSAPKARAFTRRIAAVLDHQDATTDRRIAIPFSAMHKADLLAGWADFQTLVNLEPNSLDAITIPFMSGLTDDHFNALRTTAPILFLDVPAPMALDEAGMDELFAALKQVDTVTVPTELLANKFRAYHPRVFCIPDVLDGDIWRGFERPTKRKVEMESDHAAFGKKYEVVIGVQSPEINGEALEHALQAVINQFGEQVRLSRFEWMHVRPADAPKVYGEFDLVVVPSPIIPSQVTDAPVLPAMAAGCAIVADRHYRLIKHGTTGTVVSRDTASGWFEVIRRQVQDSRNRQLQGKNARSLARRYTATNLLNKLFLPYRLSIPAGEPVAYDFPSF